MEFRDTRSKFVRYFFSFPILIFSNLSTCYGWQVKFTYMLYDLEKSNVMSVNCLVRLAKDCYIDYKRNPTALRLIRKINQLHLESNEEQTGTGITLENFAAFTRSHPSLFAPVLAIQKLFHIKTFGIRTWNRFQRDRNQMHDEELYQLFSEFNPFFFINFALREPKERNVKVSRDPNILFKKMSYRETVAMNKSNVSNSQQQLPQQQSMRRRSSGGSEGITLRPLRMTSTNMTTTVDAIPMVPPYGAIDGNRWGGSSRAISKQSQEPTAFSNNYYFQKSLAGSASNNTDIATARSKNSSRRLQTPTNRSSMSMFSTMTGGMRSDEEGNNGRRTSLPSNSELSAASGSRHRNLGTSNTYSRSYDNKINSNNNYNYYNINNKTNNFNGMHRKQLSSISLRGPSHVLTDQRLESVAVTTGEANKGINSMGGYSNVAVNTTESRVRFHDGRHRRTSSSSSLSFQQALHENPADALKGDIVTHPIVLANLTSNSTDQHLSARRSTALAKPSSSNIYKSTIHHSSRSLMGSDSMTTRSSKVIGRSMNTDREENQRISLRQRLERQRSNHIETVGRQESNAAISRNRAQPSTDLYNGKIEDFYFTSPYHNFVSMQTNVINQPPPPPPRQLTTKASKSYKSSKTKNGLSSASPTPTSSNNNNIPASHHSSPLTTPSRQNSMDTGSAASRSPSSFVISPSAYFRPIAFRAPTTTPPPSTSMNQSGVTNYRNNNSSSNSNNNNYGYISPPTEVVDNGGASKSAPLSNTSPMKQLKKVPLEAQRAYSARMIASQKSSSSSSLFSVSNYSPNGDRIPVADDTERVDTAPHLL